MFWLLPVVGGVELPIEHLAEVSAVLARLEELGPIHKNQLELTKQDWTEEERQAEIGYSAELQHEGSKALLTVHMSEFGWVLMVSGDGDGDLQITRGDMDPAGIVVFLHPEWTEFETNELRSPESARRLVSTWLSGGSIADSDS